MIDTIVNIVSYILLALAVITMMFETLVYLVPWFVSAEEHRASIIPLILFIGAAVAKYIAT